jgi:hypothetical protein
MDDDSGIFVPAGPFPGFRRNLDLSAHLSEATEGPPAGSSGSRNIRVAGGASDLRGRQRRRLSRVPPRPASLARTI